ncbi:uncharacterized protein COLE_00656 [Cutaneotrichosporon oleaginosum]|uniref:uncharacterized protein n=1 Tax=Cutaneotrichosporon oleaginosum TaxID=879819 RepID=UPI0013275565|nr:hypothetical protein COLE_00656 [Cutaneotrichosporon oleaginosum]
MTSDRDKELPLPPGAVPMNPAANGYHHNLPPPSPLVNSPNSPYTPVFSDTASVNSLHQYSSNDPPTYSKIAHTFTPLEARRNSKTKDVSPLAQVDPITHLPATFRINTHYTPPFVTIPEILDHLTFLACLHCLQEDVRDAPFYRDDIKGRPPIKPRRRGSCEGSDEEEDDDPLIDGDVKWTAFCLRAAARFDRWATSESLLALADEVLSSGRPLVDRHGQTFLSEAQMESVIAGVDIDVLMAWHSYMLNPGVYADDMERAGGERGRLRGLKALGAFPLRTIARRIDPDTFVWQPRRKDAELEPILLATHPNSLVALHDTRSALWMSCAACGGGVEIPVIGPPPTGTGLVSHNMAVPCPHCTFIITHEQLRLDRMIRDLAELHYQRVPFLPGLGPGHQMDTLTPAASVAFSRALVEATTSRFYGYKPMWYDNAKTDPPITTGQVGERTSWTVKHTIQSMMNEIVKEGLIRPIFQNNMMGTDVKTTRATLRKALARYARVYSETYLPTISFDLGAAIMRQASFVGSMEKIGWLEVSRWRDAGNPDRFYLLQKAAARYHAFLDLMSVHPKAFLSPTLDIDLCWHTHQLLGAGYVRDTMRYVGRFINHDDKVADVTLKRAYDETATRWALRFGTAYSGCGCPVAFEAEATLKRVLKSDALVDSPLKFWKRKQRAASMTGALQDVMTLKGSTFDEQGALCPSTHNRVKVEGSHRIDGARNSMFSKKVNYEHPDPFTTYYVFVPRAVPRPGKRRRRGSQMPRRGSTSSRSTTSTSANVYWGVAPHSYYGPYGLTNPWCMPMGVASEFCHFCQLTC